MLVLALGLLTGGGAVQAQDFCRQIESLIEQSDSRFAAILKEPSDKPGDHAVTVTLANADDCGVTRRSRRSWYQCSWEFPHRAPAAYERFERFSEEMKSCLGERARLTEDQSVNHPDSYALRGFELPQADVSVSIKAKGAQAKTFVFVRLHAKNLK